MSYAEFTYCGGNNEHDLIVEYDSTPYVPERRYLSNGDPGYPAEGGDFDLTSIKLKGREIIQCLSEKTIISIRDELMRELENQGGYDGDYNE